MLEQRLPLIDAELTLAALATLSGPGPGPGACDGADADALIGLSDRYDRRRGDDLPITAPARGSVSGTCLHSGRAASGV
jgi:hypothetical protein